MITQLLESFESTVSSYLSFAGVSNISPYVWGATATGIGIFVGSMYSDNETMLEFHKHMDKESYFQEMKSLFIRKDQFSKASIFVALAIIFILLLEIGFFFVIASKLKKFNDAWSLSRKNTVDRLEKIEDVIESILKDSANLDIKQMKFFRTELDQQRNSFKDFITNKSLELETKISSTKTSCQKIKLSVHNDMKKVVDTVSKLQSMKNNFAEIRENIEITKVETSALRSEVAKAIEEAKEKVNSLKNDVEGSQISFQESQKKQEVDLFKCNAILINSEILFEAAIAKFEEIEAIEKSQELNESRVTRLVECLQKALSVKEYLESNQIDHSIQNKELISRELPFSSVSLNTNSFENSVNCSMYELQKRLLMLEEKFTNQTLMINKNTDKIKNLDTSTSEKFIGMKFQGEEWITAWVSVIYSLFNSSFLQLENQLFGIDCLEYPTIFDVANEKLEENSSLFYNIMDLCKEKCLKIVKEVNLLIFEYYLVQNSYSGTNSSLLSMCNSKIDQELFDLFIHFEQTIKKSTISHSKQIAIINNLSKLKMDLTADLKQDTAKFNLLFKQNLEDFYLIHDTMKSLFNGSESRTKSVLESEKKEEIDDSIIEISDNSHSLLSGQEDSSCSEDEVSFNVNDFSDTPLKPFKLSGSMKRREQKIKHSI